MKRLLAVVVTMCLAVLVHGMVAECKAAGAAVLLAQEEASQDEDPFKGLEQELGSGDSQEDPFAGLDASLGAEAEAPTERTFLADVVDNFEGKASTRVMAHYYEAEQRDDRRDKKRVFVEAKLDFKSKVVRPRYMLNGSGWAEAGNQNETYAGIWKPVKDDRRTRRYAELNELNLVLTQENFDFTIGKKLFPMGLSTLYVPSDRITYKDLNDPVNPKAIGVYQATLDVYQGPTTYTFALLPFFSPSKQPSETSRWSGNTHPDDDGSDFYNRTVSEEDEVRAQYPAATWRNIGGLARIKTVYRGWDLFVAAAHGIGPYPVLRLEETRADGTKVHVREWVHSATLSGGFSTTYKKFEFHGEALGQYTYEGKDDDYVNYVGGLTYTLDTLVKRFWLDRVDLTVEYAGEYVIDEQDKEDFERSSQDARMGRNNIIGRINLKVNEDLSGHYFWNYDFGDQGRMQRLGLEYNFWGDWTVKVASEFFNGPNDSYFGRWIKNDRLVTTLEYRF